MLLQKMKKGEEIWGKEGIQQHSGEEFSLTISKLHKLHKNDALCNQHTASYRLHYYQCETSQGSVLLEDADSSYKVETKYNFRQPRRTLQESSPEPLCFEKPRIRRIIVDLRPTLRQVMSPDEDQNDCPTLNLEQPPFRSPECLGQPEESTILSKPVSQPRRSEVKIYLPSVSNNHLRSEASPAPAGHQLVSLVAVRDDGILSCKSESKPSDSHPVCFPKIILSPGPLQKTQDESKILKNVKSGWHNVEKLQMPLSELVRVAKERADCGHHTLINRVLYALRETREHEVTLTKVAIEKMYRGNSYKAQKTSCADGNIKLTWAKRS